MEIFPKDMTTDMSLETVTAKLTYFQLQLQLLHWQTTSFSEHKATDALYAFVSSFKDDVVEKLMGYTNRRVKAYTLAPLGTENTVSLVNHIISYAYSLEKWAETNKYCDIENLAQELSGEAAKTKYLLTLK
jgi:DNA-binding ferritin-like protein